MHACMCSDSWTIPWTNSTCPWCPYTQKAPTTHEKREVGRTDFPCMNNVPATQAGRYSQVRRLRTKQSNHIYACVTPKFDKLSRLHVGDQSSTRYAQQRATSAAIWKNTCLQRVSEEHHMLDSDT